jgi:uncharacterized protein (TIGR02145 family)
MNQFFLAAFACFLNVVSFGQVISNDTVIYDLGTILMFQGYSTNHIKLSAKRTDMEKLGLKGSVKNIQMQTWHWEEYCGHELVKTELYKEIIDFDVNGNRTTCQKTFDGFEVLNYKYERDERGFITRAKVTQPCDQGADAVEYYKYDSLGNVIMERRQDVDGYIWSITNRIFNANGELIREKRALSDDFVVFSEKYERSGKSIKVIDLMSDNIWRGKLNDSGEIVRLVNQRRFQTKEFTYDFDSIGNWTSKIVFLNGKKIMEETRQIQYHSSSHSDVKKEFIVVKIGGQMWMNENLDIKNFNNGDVIIQAQCEYDWEQAFLNKTPAWCYCQDEDGNLTKDVLYNHFVLIDPRGIAPEGYRIATLEDWNILFSTYGGLEGAFQKLKDPDSNDLNTAGIKGYRRGTWLLPESYWWTKDEKKICLAIDNVGKMLIFENQGKENYYKDGLLLRCVKE